MTTTTTLQWYAPLPSGYARATSVAVMRDEFRTLGVALPVVLLAEAEAQKQQRRGDGQDEARGVLRMSYSELAYLTASDAETVRRAVERWAELGKFVDIELRDFDFSARWRDWDRWQPRRQSAVQRAEEFLRETLGDGQRRPSAEVERVAIGVGIAGRTLDAARKSLGVEATREGGEWYVHLPRTQERS